MIGLVTVVVADGNATSLFYVWDRVALDELRMLHEMAPRWSLRAYPDGEHSMGRAVWTFHPRDPSTP